MKAAILQMAIMTSWGNSYLQNHMNIENYSDSLNHHSFKFCKAIEFVDMYPPESDEAIEVIYATNPLDWLKMLKNWGYTELRILYYPDQDRTPRERRLFAAFVQVEEWGIETVREGTSNIWRAIWHYDQNDQNDQSTEASWHVSYETIDEMAHSETFQKRDHVIGDTRKSLAKNLVALIDFAKSEGGLEPYVKRFEDALIALDDDDFKSDRFFEYIAFTEDFSLKSLQLMRAIDRAWVFGGMGSWNDLYFSDPNTLERYEELSNDLYNLCCVGLVDAINFGFSKK